MYQSAVRILQEVLKAKGLYSGKIDGDRGTKTHIAASKFVTKRKADLSGDPANWSGKRLSVAAYQLHLTDEGFDIGDVDGLWGLRTDGGHEGLEEKREFGAPLNWRDVVPGRDNPHKWPADGAGQADLKAFYGQPGNAKCTAGKVVCPWRLKLDWDRNVATTKISCHEKVAGSLQRVLNAVAAKYTEDQIDDLGLNIYGGCYNKRKKRGGSTWSTHAWGVALDFDPSRNKLKWGRDKANFARPEYGAWWEAWEAEGWLSLGRERNFDWMHVQAVKLR